MDERRVFFEALDVITNDSQMEIVIDDGSQLDPYWLDELGITWGGVVDVKNWSAQDRRLFALALTYGHHPPMWWNIERGGRDHVVLHGVSMSTVEQQVRDHYEPWYESQRRPVYLHFSTTDEAPDTLRYELDFHEGLPFYMPNPKFNGKFREEYELQGNTAGLIPLSPDLRVVVSVPLPDVFGTRSTIPVGTIRQIGDNELKPNHLFHRNSFAKGGTINGVIFTGTLTRV